MSRAKFLTISVVLLALVFLLLDPRNLDFASAPVLFVPTHPSSLITSSTSPQQSSHTRAAAAAKMAATAHPSDCKFLVRRMEPHDESSVDCSAYGMARRQNGPVRIHYGMMVGYETDVLEVALHEIYPVVDSIILVETVISHSLRKKEAVFWKTMESRVQRFKDKIQHKVLTLESLGRLKDGWAVEKAQRNSIIKVIFERRKNISLQVGDIIVGNADVDEIINRKTLAKWKYCEAKGPFPLRFFLLQMRFSFRCLEHTHLSSYGCTVSYVEKGDKGDSDLYRLRSFCRKNIDFKSGKNLTEGDARVLLRDVSWHMSSFGSVKDVLRKNQNSPHRFLDHLPSEDKIRRAIQDCDNYGRPMTKVSLPLEALPVFVQQNECYFKRIGWL